MLKEILNSGFKGSAIRIPVQIVLTTTNKTKAIKIARQSSTEIKLAPIGLVGSEESDLGFPLHPECAIQTDANWYFLHGIFG